MPLVSMRQLLDEAARGGYGVGAFNVNHMEQIQAIMEVPVNEIQLGVRNGVRKVFAESPEKFDPRDYLKPARAAMQELIARRMRDFGQAGHAGDYDAILLDEMRARYEAAAATA